NSKCAISSSRSVCGRGLVGSVGTRLLATRHYRNLLAAGRDEIRCRPPYPENGSATCFFPNKLRIDGPNAAKLRIIMTNENKYIPIKNPIAICIVTIKKSQMKRVRLGQIKMG